MLFSQTRLNVCPCCHFPSVTLCPLPVPCCGVGVEGMQRVGELETSDCRHGPHPCLLVRAPWCKDVGTLQTPKQGQYKGKLQLIVGLDSSRDGKGAQQKGGILCS